MARIKHTTCSVALNRWRNNQPERKPKSAPTLNQWEQRAMNKKAEIFKVRIGEGER